VSDFIQHVSDTSIWVAYYRALESERPDSLFKDPFARILVGDRVSKIEKLNSEVTKWTRWTVVMRTYIIDQMIKDLMSEGVTTFLNLGAGLDTRPYRLNLGSKIRWIEADFSHVIEHKQKVLEKFNPTCQLESIGIDLSNRASRQSLFAQLARNHPKVAVLTEGVLPYLTEQQVSELSEDLGQHTCFSYWICEYISKASYRYLKNPKRMNVLRNAPFQFYPEDWMGFFEKRKWHLVQSRFFNEISENLGRPTPMPKIFIFFELLMGKKWAAQFKQMSGFLLWKR
jgi:methyltransferase (TIGR00027 family)